MSERVKTYVRHHGTAVPLYLPLFYLALEFGRPQETIPGLSALHLPAIVTIALALSFVFAGKLDFSARQTKLFLLLLALMVLHIPLATNNFWAFQITKTMLITFVAYLGLIMAIDTIPRFQTLITVWLAVHGYLAVQGIRNGGVGIGGFLQDENDFSMTLNMVLPLALFLAIAETNKRKKFLYIGLLLLFLFANMMTLSRGGFIGLVTVALYVWLRSSKKLMSTVVIALLVVFMAYAAPQKYWAEMGTITEEKTDTGTGEERVYQWGIGWQVFLDHWLIGVGQGNIPFRFRAQEDAEGLHGRSRAGRAVHSLYFTLFPELGLLGTLIFCGMLIYTWKDLALIRRFGSKRFDTIVPLTYAMEASLVAFLVSSLFISTLYYPNVWLLMGFVLALKKAVLLNDEKHPDPSLEPQGQAGQMRHAEAASGTL